MVLPVSKLEKYKVGRVKVRSQYTRVAQRPRRLACLSAESVKTLGVSFWEGKTRRDARESETEVTYWPVKARRVLLTLPRQTAAYLRGQMPGVELLLAVPDFNKMEVLQEL